MANGDPARKRGILNERERKYLLGEADEEYAPADERAVRGAIRNHLKNSVLDFSILFRHLSDRDRRLVFAPDEGHDDPNAFSAGIRDAISLFYLGRETATLEGFAPTLRAAVSNAVNKISDRRRGVDVDLDVTVSDPVGLEEIAGKIDTGGVDELTEPELREFLDWYQRADEFDPEIALREREEFAGLLDGPDPKESQETGTVTAHSPKQERLKKRKSEDENDAEE